MLSHIDTQAYRCGIVLMLAVWIVLWVALKNRKGRRKD